MKKLLLFITLISFGITQAQIVNIPDANFKNALLNHNPVIDVNGDNEIQITEAQNATEVKVASENISDLTGIEEFTNIWNLRCSNNQLTNLDLSNNILLTDLYCNDTQLINLDLASNVLLEELLCNDTQLVNLNLNNLTELFYLECNRNYLTTLDLSTNSNLQYIECRNNGMTSLTLYTNSVRDFGWLLCDNNQLSELDMSNMIGLSIFCSNNNLNSLVLDNSFFREIFCNDNQFVNLDFSQMGYYYSVNCNNNPMLNYINLKNGELFIDGNFQNLPNLETVCVDDINSDLVNQINTEVNHSVTFTEYCSLTPALSNQITGTIQVDLDLNGCDTNDLHLPNVLVTTDNGSETFSTFSSHGGEYTLYTNEGDFTTVISNLPVYYTVNPNSHNSNFVGFGNTDISDFCVAPNQTATDINITLLPITSARPGFYTTYQIVYKNVGTTQLNGNVTLEFDETKLNFLNASETVNTQTSNSLTFNYANLNPFETRTIDLEFNTFAPPTVEIDDILNFTATINPIAGDFTTDDNIFDLNQTVVGSFDPNDITVLEGNQILLADANKYLHYLIRFQNTGTASAINVVVTNDLDVNLDWSTLQLESLSHDNRVAIKNGNEIEFIFENINLPDSTTDEPNSHGFIAYKIKPKTDITLGDIIPNKADIFFDFNEAIETNIATTTVVNALAVNENRLLDFSVYPTPTENILNINSKTEITKIEIYSKLGQKIKETIENNIDISNLTQGLYFVKVEDINGDFGVKKIIKK